LDIASDLRRNEKILYLSEFEVQNYDLPLFHVDLIEADERGFSRTQSTYDNWGFVRPRFAFYLNERHYNLDWETYDSLSLPLKEIEITDLLEEEDSDEEFGQA
jgi:hypothetical protein